MQANTEELVIRSAEKRDIPNIVALIRAMARYEKLTDQIELDEATLDESLFSDNPVPRALVATLGSEMVGYAIYFYNFSTFLGTKGIYLEDIYVDTEYRGQGIGDKLFRKVADIARLENCGRMEWVALDWNKPAINFYESRGAKMHEEWRLFRFTRAELNSLSND